MASDDSDFEPGIISEEELASVCDFGNEQTWLYCPEGTDPNSLLDLRDFLCVPARSQPTLQSYRGASVSTEKDATKSGGIDTGTFTRPKKMSFQLDDFEVRKPEFNISSQPSGDVINRHSFLLSHSPKKTTSLKDVTNSTYSTSKRFNMLRLANFDDFNDSILHQTMLSDLSAPTFLSISDSDDGMSENHPNVPSSVSKRYDTRTRRINNPADVKIGYEQSQYPAVSSTPKIPRRKPARTSISDLSFVKPNTTVLLDQTDDSVQSISEISDIPGESSSSPRASDGSIDAQNALNGTFAELEISSPRCKSPSGFIPRSNGLRRLSHNTTFNLGRKTEPHHFKSVESGLNDTRNEPESFSEVTNNMVSFIVENPYSPSSAGSLQRSLGDVHLAAQKQEYELRDSVASMPTVPVPTLKSPLKKVLSENCLFSSEGDRRLRLAPNHHSSVSNLSLNHKDNNNCPSGLLSTQIPVAGARRSGLPVSIRGAGAKTRSRLPTRLPRFQAPPPKSSNDWTDGCY